MPKLGSVMRVKRDTVYPIEVTLVVWACPECGVVYGMPESLADSIRSHGGHYFCPNGDSLSWYETDADRERKRRAEAEAEAIAARRRADQAEAAARTQRERAGRAERSAIAYRGHLTRIKNRIVAGVCPVPGCKRTGLVQTMRHIATKHPAWHAEHADELTTQGAP